MVHFNVCGPLKEKSFSGALYFVTFIDDYSRKLWVYAMKTKDQVLKNIKEFHTLVERKTCKKLKCVCSNNGGEYCGPFHSYFNHHGFAHEKTPPKTPQLNALAVSVNQTLMERVRFMFFEAKLSNHYLGEALYTAVCVLNLTCTVALNNKVQEKKLVWKECQV